ncbi:hypothetical protein K7432_005794 [Basidiobolus ranarum]|uniref:Late embryogenesis abundant protein LEA-2 subgroup domain-containing protein n=1 Tax=Basidiobolus ranarum TaxID=34480 RepID=A0ABR2WVX7_9FUNG
MTETSIKSLALEEDSHDSSHSTQRGHNNRSNSYISVKSSKKRRCSCCCCCCRTRKSRCICAIITVLILIGIAIALYFCIPRGMPDVSLENFTILDLDAKEAELKSASHMILPKVLTLDVDLYLKTQNPNLIPIKVNDILVNAYYVGENLKIKVAQGSLPAPVTFKPNSNTIFTLPLKLAFNTTDNESLWAIRDLLDRCGITGPNKQQLIISYDAEITVALISWLGIKPTISNDIRFDCPLNSDFDILKI